MTTNYTDNIGITKIGTGEQAGTWGTTTNTNFDVFDQAITGYDSVDVGTSNDYTLVFADGVTSESKNAVLTIGGSPTATCIINVPLNKSRLYTFENGLTTDYPITIKSQSSVNTVTIPHGKTTQVYTDGTNVYPVSDYLPSVTLGAALPVTSGGTGQTSYTDGQLLIGNTATGGLAKTTITAGSGITVTNGNGSITIANNQAGGSVTSVDVSGGTTGLTTSGGPVTTSGTITIGGTLGVSNGGTGGTTAAAARTALGVPSLTGSGASGTWPINVSGTSAATVQADQATKLDTTTGTAPVYGVRAYASWTMAGTVLTQTQSGNLTISRVNTGQYIATFNTPMPTSTYAIAFAGGWTVRSTPVFSLLNTSINSYGFTFFVSNGSGAAVDYVYGALTITC